MKVMLASREENPVEKHIKDEKGLGIQRACAPSRDQRDRSGGKPSHFLCHICRLDFSVLTNGSFEISRH